MISLGLDATAIVTLPKRGLKLNDHLIIAPYCPSPPLPITPSPSADEMPAPPPGPAISARAASLRQTGINVALGIAVIATLLMAYVYLNRQDEQPLFFLAKADSCDIYTFRPIAPREKEPTIRQLGLTMKDNIEKCTAHQFVLFSFNIVSNSQIRNNINQRYFMAKCTRDTRGNIANCLNFYFYNWDQQ
ncbi:hypothetical protein ABK905_12060 [Acerihabitans sp. KWT182]|uniref:Uncharacterized protein n=1 Tax=Acerihabitans sp. KWT182 TaxID=3157919 RepID=A0AAU7QEL2_9GAMM